MNLLIDIGNSRLKWTLQTDNNISHGTALCHQSANFTQQLTQNWQSLPIPKILAISSVSSEKITSTVIKLAHSLWDDIKIIIAKSSAEAFGVKNSYSQPQKLGVDRWLSLIAAYNAYQQAVWVVDCGTAITLDLIDAQGLHQGGLISPGLQLMKSSLLTNTAGLNTLDNGYRLGLATKTSHAIFSGTLYAATGLIEGTINRHPLKAMRLFTGGDAKIIAENISLSVTIDADLVLKGLAIFMQKYL